MEYYLEFTSPSTNKTVSYKTYEFAKKNSSYLKTNQINLVAATKNGVKVTPVASDTTGKTDDKSIPKPSTAPTVGNTNNNQTKKTTSPLLMIFVLIIFVFVIIGIGIWIFFRQKNS